MRTRLPFSFFAIFLILTVAACAPPEQAAPEPEPEVDIAAEQEAIRDLSMEWMEAANARDGATLDSLMAQNAVTIFDGEIYEGQAAIAASREAEWAENPEFVVSWVTSAVEVAASGDLAYERGSWTSDPDGPGEAAEEHGEYVTVWNKIDGQWRAVVDAGTTLEAEDEE
ncbi:MAG: nuclear transport factor 2 family protein [Thermoanaerobaculia bacterium]